ncbi:hypothetical protein ACFO25_08560 [Paenactinomyces guangxiensis]|uniref:Uncharacterized protein n=1 Tax=Paenactinomyces guangxiensis TaxID=1490290 RepID=A0A7W2A7L2_9BACL|nr:hypothetical protein [Paenactinomyces guangxiensis]MBA4492903.1 hypothetical protein [Paenactinomyces guangxiensis]MBH8590248.1 hypothetical protein [Paenactinomyces guangxiensis]
MLKIYIESIETGAEYNDIIYDFWINAKLREYTIKIFDSVPFDLRNKKNEYINALVLAGFLEKNDTDQQDDILTGTMINIEEQELSRWKQTRFDIKERKWLGIKNKNGYFLIDPNEAKELNIDIGENVTLKAGRFDLVGLE